MANQVRQTLRLYTPHAKQLELHNCRHRFIVAAFGRQSGKSTWAINELCRWAWERPESIYWYVSPTFAQSRVMYRRLIGMLWPAMDSVIKKNQTELRVKFINQSEIRFVSAEVYQNLRGSTLHGCIIDEVREVPIDLWPMVIRPMLTTTKGRCAFISTPNGYDHFFDLSKNAGTYPDEWAFFKAPSTANPLFTQDEFEAARRSMSQAQFEQEVLAEFRSLTAGRAYMFYGDQNNVTECPFAKGKLWSPYHSVVLGMDFNLSPMAWTLGQTAADDWYWFDEVWLKQSHTQEAAIELAHRVKLMKDQGYRGEPNLILCGDATGKATQRTSNKSDYDIVKAILTEHGITFSDRTPESNPAIKDRVNAVNARLKDASGKPHFFIYKQGVPMLSKDLERVVWKPGTQIMLDQTSDSDLTHSSDSIGYPISALTPVKAIGEIGKMKVIQRWV